MFNQLRGIFAHTEEISLLLGRLHLAPAVRALAVHQLGLRKEGLAGSAVKPFVVALIDIPLVIKLLEDFLHLGLVSGIRGTDEFIIGSVHQVPDPPDFSGSPVHEFLRGHSCGLGLLLNLLTVLICSGLEEYIISLFPFIPGNAVSQNNLIGIANVGFSGGIGNGCGNIIWFFTILTHNHFPLFL